MVYLNTDSDDDAENEAFRITASATADARDGQAISAAATAKVDKDIVIEDDPGAGVQAAASRCAGKQRTVQGRKRRRTPVEMKLIVSPARTLPKSFFVNLESAQDASDYSLTSGGTSSGGPTAVSLRIDMPGGWGDSRKITLTSASNDGDRVDDTITLQLFETSATSPTTAGDMVGDDVMLKVVDQHKLPKVTMGSIMVDGARP